jgi:hypothetical protein
MSHYNQKFNIEISELSRTGFLRRLSRQKTHKSHLYFGGKEELAISSLDTTTMRFSGARLL